MEPMELNSLPRVTKQQSTLVGRQLRATGSPTDPWKWKNLVHSALAGDGIYGLVYLMLTCSNNGI